MKAAKITIDFGDRPELVRLLRLHAAREGKSQKDIVASALEDHFAHLAENELVLKLAEPTFAEWDNREDDVYNDL